MPNEAILSNKGAYTIFQYDRYIIRFRAPYQRLNSIEEMDTRACPLAP